MITDFHQLWFIGKGTDLESQQKTRNARYRSREPWSPETTPHMLRERERQTDIQTNTCRYLERQIDRQTEKCNRRTQ